MYELESLGFRIPQSPLKSCKTKFGGNSIYIYIYIHKEREEKHPKRNRPDFQKINTGNLSVLKVLYHFINIQSIYCYMQGKKNN